MQEEAKEASRNMLTKSFDMEELWFAAVGGRLKAWGAQSHPELKVSAPCDGAGGKVAGCVGPRSTCLLQPELRTSVSTAGIAAAAAAALDTDPQS
jgi:hypothetical protein